MGFSVHLFSFGEPRLLDIPNLVSLCDCENYYVIELLGSIYDCDFFVLYIVNRKKSSTPSCHFSCFSVGLMYVLDLLIA